MKTLFSNSFETVASLGNSISSLELDPKSGIYRTPYIEKPLENFDGNKKTLTMYEAEDIAFVNTSDFTKTGQKYLRTGRYTDAHPVYDREEFNAFWDEEERRCIEGYTLPGKLIKENGIYKMQEVHITGEHYGYLNFGEIKRSKEFELKKGALVSDKGEKVSKVNSTGGSKSFYLPDFWDGDYYFFKAVELCREVGKHLVVGKARRKGYSYKNGWLVASRANFYRRSNSVVGAYDSASLYEDGTMNKVMNYLDFILKHTDWKKRRLANTLDHIELGFRLRGESDKRGYLSNIYSAVLKTNPGGMRGKDADLLLLEEAGKCPNLSDILDATLKTLSDGIYTTGLMIVFGTGGGDENQWQGFEDLFYETWARKFITFENVWDDDMKGTGCGYFHASFMNKPGLIDKHGNSDIKSSMAFEELEKANVSHDPAKLNAYEMEEPDRPSKAFSRANNPIFPAIQLDDQLRRVSRDPNFQGISREGIFVRTPTGVKFIDRLLASEEEKLLIPPVVDTFPTPTGVDLRGCWVLYDAPFRGKDGFIPDNLYHGWNDPYGISKTKEHYNSKDSLACTIIYEGINNFTKTRGDRLVAIYIGRHEDTEDYDDQMFLGLQYFNAKLLYENDRGDVYSNAKKRGLLEILKDEPEFQYQKELQRGGMGRKKGISIAGNAGRKANGVVYLKKWLLESRGFDANGNKLLNLHYIYSIGVLKELLKYDGKRNTDRVSTLIIGMFDIRETLYKGTVPDDPDNYNEAEDDFFNNPFN